MRKSNEGKFTLLWVNRRETLTEKNALEGPGSYYLEQEPVQTNPVLFLWNSFQRHHNKIFSHLSLSSRKSTGICWHVTVHVWVTTPKQSRVQEESVDLFYLDCSTEAFPRLPTK